MSSNRTKICDIMMRNHATYKIFGIKEKDTESCTVIILNKDCIINMSNHAIYKIFRNKEKDTELYCHHIEQGLYNQDK